MTVVPDGHQRRDFTHVSDVVQANIKAMETDTDKYGQVFNVGTGTNHSVLELAALISDEHVFIEPRIGEARVTLAGNNKLRETFGWEPTVQLEDWIKEQLRIESLCLTDS